MADPKKDNPLLGSFRAHPTEEKPPAPPDTSLNPTEGKKTPEPPKVAAPTVPGKPVEEKKPTEPPKAPEGKKPAEKGEEIKEDKASAAPGKTGKEKPTEPPKAPEGKKPDDNGRGAKVTEKKEPTEEVDKDGIPKDFSMVIVPKEKLGQVTMMAMEYIDDFEGHPFPVRDDEDMVALVDSIKQVGILEPATIIRNPKKPGRFEMVAGHRRMHAAKLAGLAEIPVIVRNMDHDEATIYMVDSNLKRDKPLTPMEKARAYTMRAEALKRKTGRRSKEEIAAMEASGQKPLTADEEIARQTGESVAQVQRLKTLTKLTPPLQKMVDDKKLPVNTAVDIAQMKPQEQEKLADAIEKEGGTVPSGSKAKELKEASKAGTLTEKKIEAAVAPTKREVEPPLKVTLMEEDLLPYFSKGTTVPDVKKGIFEGLEVRKKLIERQKAKATAEKDPGKKAPAPAR
ncbi:MAG: ParB/RepB/Spo0J family partition protein [Oscillospiraceae bacterium]|nr:ParB/RepB/Spo0J family partition protein [Oscillospiraceae bacterium]